MTLYATPKLLARASHVMRSWRMAGIETRQWSGVVLKQLLVAWRAFLTVPCGRYILKAACSRGLRPVFLSVIVVRLSLQHV